MPIDNWGTPLRDVLTEVDVAISPAELNDRFLAFYRSDGEPYSAPYTNINARLPAPISSNRVETWKKLFDSVGLLYVDDGKIRLSKFGRLFGGQWARLNDEAAISRRTIAESAVGVLGRYQLLNPTTRNRAYPADADVFPYRAIWQSMVALGDLHWEELHRVLLRVMRKGDLPAAIAKIEAARADPAYNPQNPTSATTFLGAPIYPDSSQATRRMTPWFSVAGFGGLLIDREATQGRRRLNPDFVQVVERELSTDRDWINFGDDGEAWFAHLDSGVKDATGLPMTSKIEIGDDDPIYKAIVELVINDGMGGALLVGPPGTGKSWYARQVALKLTSGDPSRMREVQFHPSYQYEDFVEGYVPDAKEGFRLADKHLLQMIERARSVSGPVVMVIDEFSRTDPARVLGEALTYMEGSLRDVSFSLPSGRTTSIPKNLIFIATMNPNDRSVDEIDAALDRRWAKISLQPDPEKVRHFLANNECPETLRGPILEFFAKLQSSLEVGHAFFRSVRDVNSLHRLWETQLQFMAKKKFRFDADSLQEVQTAWAGCVDAANAAAASPIVEDAQNSDAPQPPPAGT